MEGTLKVDKDKLKEQAKTTRLYLQSAQNSMDNLYTYLSNMKSYWTGNAADSYWTSYTKLNNEAEKILSDYDDHITDLEVMAGVYQSAEVKAVEQAEELPASTLV